MYERFCPCIAFLPRPHITKEFRFTFFINVICITTKSVMKVSGIVSKFASNIKRI